LGCARFSHGLFSCDPFKNTDKNQKSALNGFGSFFAKKVKEILKKK
jgi:hypothetical protein